MTAKRNPDWPAPIIESQTLEKASPPPGPQSPHSPIARLILRGQNFFSRAISPAVKIGNLKILDFEILPDEKTMILHLFERPPEGGKVSICYEPENRVEGSQPFQWNE